MAWWRERLEELDRGGHAPAEPRLRDVADRLLPLEISGRDLSELEDCWLALLSPFPWSDAVAGALRKRGEILFGIAARLLGRRAEEAEPFGAVWSLVDGARHCTDAASRAVLVERAKMAIAELPPSRIAGELRPLTMIAALAAYDLLYHGRPGLRRSLSALRHSMFGIMPR